MHLVVQHIMFIISCPLMFVLSCACIVCVQAPPPLRWCQCTAGTPWSTPWPSATGALIPPSDSSSPCCLFARTSDGRTLHQLYVVRVYTFTHFPMHLHHHLLFICSHHHIHSHFTHSLSLPLSHTHTHSLSVSFTVMHICALALHQRSAVRQLEEASQLLRKSCYVSTDFEV